MNSTQFTLANRNTIGSMIFPGNWASEMTILFRESHIPSPPSVEEVFGYLKDLSLQPTKHKEETLLLEVYNLVEWQYMTSWPYEDFEDPWSQQQQDNIIPIIATRIPISLSYDSINWLIIKGSKLAIAFLA
eukprot:8092724-Heterocapsa_arctica.AAC.1